MTSSSNEAPASKRARMEDEDLFCTTKRTEELTHKIQDLAKSFPELKYIIDLPDLSKIVEPAVAKYKNEVATEQNEKNSLLYNVPDEILKSCFSYVGKGNFLLVAPVSKKFHHMYKTIIKGDYDSFSKGDKWHTYYSIAAKNVSTAKYCLDIIGFDSGAWYFGYSPSQIFVEAAYKGHIEILKLARDLDTFSCFWSEDDDEIGLLRRPIERIAELGHLNVLQFLHNKFNLHFALPMASRGAAYGGQIHILKWLKDNNILYDFKEGQKDTLCYSALAGGKLDALIWLRQQGFNLSERLIKRNSPFHLGNMATAIETGKIEMIEYCNDLGFSFEVQSSYTSRQCDCLAIATGNIELIRYCSEIGLEFTERVLDYSYKYVTLDSLKFLRSKSLSWSPETIEHAAKLNQFDVLKYAHENGCEWSSETWGCCMKQKPRINMDMVQYLHENNCPWEPVLNLNDVNDKTDRIRILEFIFTKKLPLDEEVLFYCIGRNWLKEIKLIIENTALKDMPESLMYVTEKASCDLETMQYLYSKGIPFGEGFLRERAAYPREVPIWALENGCNVEDTEDLYQIAKKAQFFNKKLSELLLCNKKFTGLDQILERIIKHTLYRQGFGLERFKLFLDHGCPISLGVVKTIYKYWLLNSNNDLSEIVAFILNSKHPEPSIDELYESFEEGFDSDSDKESNDSSDDDDSYVPNLWPLFGF